MNRPVDPLPEPRLPPGEPDAPGVPGRADAGVSVPVDRPGPPAPDRGPATTTTEPPAFSQRYGEDEPPRSGAPPRYPERGDEPTRTGEALRYQEPTVVVRSVENPDEPVSSDRVRWGPIWGGFVVALAVFVLVQLGLFAVDATDLDLNPTEVTTRSATFWTVVAAGVGFFMGGLVAGATAKWRKLTDGFIQGIVLWALMTVALIIASSLAVGTLASSVGGILGRLALIRDQLTAGTEVTTSALEDARDAAADACLFLGITAGATALGALIGAKLWPRPPRSTR